MNTKNIAIVIGLLVVLTAASLLVIGFRNKRSSERLSVVTSFYPLAHFAQQVGGDYVEVTNLTPPGVEPHDFEPTARDVATLQTAQLVLANGSGLDSWLDRMQPDLATQNISFIRMSDEIALRQATETDAEQDADEHDSGESATDPHFWLDPLLAVQEVQRIANALVEIDPSHASAYKANALAYQQQLEKLDQSYKSGLVSCQTREIITSHAAFGYLAARYDITVHAIAGLSPDQEPSAQQLARLATLAKEHHIAAIFFETLASPRLAETLAAEIGAKTLIFNPIEGLTEDEQQQGKNYISIMEDNLQQLRIALQCDPI